MYDIFCSQQGYMNASFYRFCHAAELSAALHASGKDIRGAASFAAAGLVAAAAASASARNGRSGNGRRCLVAPWAVIRWCIVRINCLLIAISCFCY